MKNSNYMKKMLHELYVADKVFMQILQKSVQKADPMPRLKKVTNQLLKEAASQIENVEVQLEQMGRPARVLRAKSYQI